MFENNIDPSSMHIGVKRDFQALDSQCEHHCRRWETIFGAGTPFTPRTGHTVVSYNGCIYVFGGTDQHKRQNDLYQYSIATNEWVALKTRGNKPSRRSGAVGCVVKDKIYLFGGYDGRDGNYFNDLFEFDVKTMTWNEIRQNGLACFLESPKQIQQNISYRVPPPRTDHVLVYYNNSLYVFGGYDGQTRFQDVFAFDLKEKKWRVEAESEPFKPSRRFGHSGVVYGDSFWMFGGWDGRETLDCMWRYHFLERQWTCVEHSNIRPRNRYRHSAVVHGGNMYLFGGVDKEHFRFNDLYKFNFNNYVWEEVSTGGVRPSSRTFHRAVVVDAKMYILGGYDGKRRLNDLRSIFLGNLSPPTLMDLCSQYIRRNAREISEKFQLDDDVAQHLTDLIWRRDKHGILRSGAYYGSEVICTGFELQKQDNCDSIKNRCAACGLMARAHQPLLNDNGFTNFRTQPDMENMEEHMLFERKKAKFDEFQNSINTQMYKTCKSNAREVLEGITNIRVAEETKM